MLYEKAGECDESGMKGIARYFSVVTKLMREFPKGVKHLIHNR